MIWTRPSLELKISWAMVPLGVATKWSLPTPWPVTVPREGSSKTRVGEEYERDGVPVEEIWSALPQMVEILARSAAG